MHTQLVTMRVVADALEVSEKTVRRRTISGEIPHYKVGNQYRYNLAEVLEAAKVRASVDG